MKIYQPRESQARIYFRNTFPFVSIIVPIILWVLTFVTHYPARITEVFLRKNFGQRYYSIEAPILIFIIMSIPLFIWITKGQYMYIEMMGFSWFWILFSFVFLGFAIKRNKEINTELQSFDDSKYTLYTGDELSLWYRFENKLPRLFKKDTFYYNIERVYEGGLFVIIGIVLLIIPFSRAVGLLLFISGCSYIITMYIRFKVARDFILDKIDERIYNEDLNDAFMNDKSKRGFRWNAPLPDDPQFRETIADSLIDQDDDFNIVS